ncbi:hypothetical protein OsccyDRAFT_2265 [Leptolyngbyaceae cyanobacterium JSC-12]|nr:hypothetical protein OsccyDRAFT_2265 [Leptolyngbyaceae cyanobacterium JSC-12]
MITLTLPQMNGSSTYKPVDEWLQSSVQTFFSQINWDDNSPTGQVSVSSATDFTDEPLSLEMSVSRFFATFSWDGNSIAAAPSVQPKPAGEGDFTLDDFSDLF